MPVSSTGNPLIVVDLLGVHRAVSTFSPPLNSLPLDELPSLARELAALGIPSGAQRCHGITGTIVHARPTLVDAVCRYDRGYPRHETQLCEAPVRDGGKAL